MPYSFSLPTLSFHLQASIPNTAACAGRYCLPRLSLSLTMPSSFEGFFFMHAVRRAADDDLTDPDGRGPQQNRFAFSSQRCPPARPA